jgi:hypothetical protein
LVASKRHALVSRSEFLLTLQLVSQLGDLGVLRDLLRIELPNN